jgi:putative restriction modification system DNA specificity subunit
MSDWYKAKIKDFADVKGGKRLPKGKQLVKEPNDHPYIRIRDLGKTKYLQLTSEYEYVDDDTQQSISRYIVNKGDILISVVGTIGLIGIVGATLDGANQTENCDKIINITGVMPEYLYYYLKSNFGQVEIRKGTVGAVQPKLPLKNVQDISVFYPPMEEQEKIVAILSAIDEKIETNEAVNNNLEQQVQTLFRNQFLTQKFLPDGWTRATLGDVSLMGAGGDKPKTVSDTQTENCPYPIYSNGISNDGLYGFTNECKIKDESITVSARGTIGFVCLRHIPYTPIVRLITLIPKTDVLSAKYLYLWLRNMHIYGTGTTQQQLTVPDFRKTDIILPTKEEMTLFTDTITPLFEAIWENQAQNLKLSNTRDALLPMLMSGKLDISYLDL